MVEGGVLGKVGGFRGSFGFYFYIYSLDMVFFVLGFCLVVVFVMFYIVY